MKRYRYKDYSAESNCDKWQYNMYRLTPQPPRITYYNDYIVDYKRTGDMDSLRFYLHFFEPRLNDIATAQCTSNYILNRFQEVKQHILECMLAKLPTYNPEIDATLEQYTTRHIEESVRKFIRDNASMYTLGKSYNEYRDLRKVNAIFYDLDLSEKKWSKDETIEEIIHQTGFKRKNIIALLEQGSDFRSFLSLDKRIHVSDDDEKVTLAETIADYSAEPERLYQNMVFERGFHAALNQLDDEERFVLVESNDLCMDCLSELPEDKQKTYQDIANILHLHSESAVQQRVRKIERFLQKELLNGNVVQACVVRFLGTEKQDGGLIRYKYAYRGIINKGEGLLDNIYDPKTKTFWGADIIEFAEGENKRYFPVAKMVINVLDCSRFRKAIGAIDTVFVETLY